ncbi:MAG: hypothetical protein R2754_16705 [Microthrixaceae bacterium]
MASPEDSLIDFGDDPRPVAYRGGSLSPEDFAQVDPDEVVETPMPLLFATGVDAKLSDRARNQVRSVVATSTEDRGDAARADPLWIQRDPDGNVALLVVIDNPTAADLTALTVRAELLKPDGESNGVAQFEIPPEEVLGVPAGSAVFLVLTMDQDRLDDEKVDVSRGGVRLDLTAS